MPAMHEIEKILSMTWEIRVHAQSLHDWLANIEWGSTISWGGVEGHLKEIEDVVAKIREKSWGGER